MLPVKVAALLLVCLTVYPHMVVGTCTKEQKDRILVDCKRYIGHGPPHPFPRDPHEACCVAAREVPEMNMHCIVELVIKDKQDKEYDEDKIVQLKHFCELKRRRQVVV